MNVNKPTNSTFTSKSCRATGDRKKASLSLRDIAGVQRLPLSGEHPYRSWNLVTALVTPVGSKAVPEPVLKVCGREIESQYDRIFALLSHLIDGLNNAKIASSLLVRFPLGFPDINLMSSIRKVGRKQRQQGDRPPGSRALLSRSGELLLRPRPLHCPHRPGWLT